MRAYLAGPLVAGPFDEQITHVRVDLDQIAARLPDPPEEGHEDEESSSSEVSESLMGCYYVG